MRVSNEFMRDFANWANAVNRAMEGGFTPYDYTSSGSNRATTQTASLPLDVVTTPEALKVYAYLPGVNPEDVEITFEGDALTIRGSLPPVEENSNFIKRELYHGSFERRLEFNVPVNGERIEAHFHNGLLTLTVPKAEAVRPKTIKVQTK
jgi:HSP20 family protein